MSRSEIAEPCCVLVPAGDFPMGCATGRDDEQPVHRVWTEVFEMAVFQVRNRDWAAFMEATGHRGSARMDEPGPEPS